MTAPILRPALDFDLAFLADLFNRSFEGYFVPVAESSEGLAARLRHDSIDLALSRVVFTGERPAGIAYVAARGRSCRVAGMGVVPEARRRGLGRRLMESAIARTRAVGFERMTLEVIEQNAPAVALYRSLGFGTLRRLVGYELAEPTDATAEATNEAGALEEADVCEVARRVAREAGDDLPWQLAPETLAAYGPPVRGYRLDDRAWALVHDPGEGPLLVHALVVARRHRRAGWGSRLARALLALHPGRSWRVPARVPEDLGAAFARELGFRPLPLTQLEMRLELRSGTPPRPESG